MNANEITYNGHQYRSQAEASWAIFFDKAGVAFVYEPKDVGGYWPDFLLPEFEKMVEIKNGKLSAAEVAKVRSQPGLIILNGAPRREPKTFDLIGYSIKEIASNGQARRYPTGIASLNHLLFSGSLETQRLLRAVIAHEVTLNETKESNKRQVNGLAMLEKMCSGGMREWSPRTHEGANQFSIDDL